MTNDVVFGESGVKTLTIDLRVKIADRWISRDSFYVDWVDPSNGLACELIISKPRVFILCINVERVIR